ncbi:chondroitinase family polysaccharide lyase [Endozoicomonas elysicola]|uniref:chondroitinase family polysaccharide lyase n=1 Tax=Endozoicomonas elysicola TaxID=305900 RepID=UPI0003A23FE9|nr:chondroitinase family polysaccharide lyase [Endozoicomonas elysicola]
MNNRVLRSAMMITSLLSAPLALAGSSVLTEAIINQRLSFESPGEYKNWYVHNGKVQTSERHFKDGRQSLLWKWENNGRLVMDDIEGLIKIAKGYPGGSPESYEPAYYTPARRGGLKLWVYREEAHPTGMLTFKVGSDTKALEDNPQYQFTMKQDFTGWRTIWVHFEEDAKVKGYSGSGDLKAMVIEPSSDMKQGEVYFDLMQFVNYVSSKRHSDEQFINNKNKNRVDTYEIKMPWNQFLAGIQDESGEPVTTEELQDIKLMTERLDQLIMGSKSTDFDQVKQGDDFTSSFQKRLKIAQKFYDSLKIQRKDGAITGVPLFSSRDEQGAYERFTFQEVAQNIFFYLAMDYQLASDADKPEKLEKVLNLFDYFEDQGWAAGSALGTIDHLIRISGYAIAVFLMRDELQETGRLERHATSLSWYTRIGSLAELDKTKGESPDAIRGALIAKLISVLVMEDGPGKVKQMRWMKDYFAHITEFSPGYAGGIKPDYTLFHHRGAYMNAYGVQAITVMSMASWLTEGTKFELPRENIERLKDTLMGQVNIAADFELHPAASGRFPLQNSGIDRFMLPAFAFMTMIDGDKETPLSSAYARAYEMANLSELHKNMLPGLSYYGSFGVLSLLEQEYQKHKNEIRKVADGTYSFPYGGLLTHKHDGWVASARGTSKYVWDYEASGNKYQNTFGRYMSFGSLMLFSQGTPLSLKDSGMDLNNGFHWSYVPGATTKAMPIENVNGIVAPTDKYIEGKHRSFTEDTYLGSLTFGKNSGIFAMDFHDTVTPDDEKTLWDDSFEFKKSYFFFGDEIVALGSGIANDDKRFDTITTLYQSVTGGKDSTINGKPYKLNAQVKSTFKGGVFGDPQGNHYVVPDSYKVDYLNDDQRTLKLKTKNKGKDSYSEHIKPAVKAYINHGKKPEKQSYEYLILPQSSYKVAQSHLKHKGYQVIQQNERAHIVHHESLDKTGYALFDKGETGHGLLLATDTPLMAMTSEKSDRLELSVADPDLRLKKWNHNMSRMPEELVHGPAKDDYIASITLKGKWQPSNSYQYLIDVDHRSGTTVLKINVKNGASQNLQLKRT